MTKGMRLVAIIALLAAGSAVSAASFVEINEGKDGQYHVTFGGKLFTTLHVKEHAKPILYPIIGPHDVRMTRDYPMKKGTPNEAKDHPHHQSLWFTHGDVNGVSFWHIGKDAGHIKTVKIVEKVNNGSRAWIVLNNNWVDVKGKIICTDTQKITFHKGRTNSAGTYSMIDYEVTIHASHGDVKFGDTKEGTMGIRMHASLRIDKGASAVNSEGVTGAAIWGKNAAWLDYSNKIDGNVVGVAIFDHPANPRHPTTWHARAYGLVAANPFGLHNFKKAKPGTGALVVKKGSDLKFKYRFVFHSGNAKSAEIAKRYTEWTK